MPEPDEEEVGGRDLVCTDLMSFGDLFMTAFSSLSDSYPASSLALDPPRQADIDVLR